MANMTAKDLHVARKRPDGIKYLMDKFGYSSEEELFEAIPKASPGNAQFFIRSLKKLQKVNNKKADNEVHESICVEDLETDENQEVEVVSSIRKQDLECLLAEEQELSQKICSIEGEHKELVSRRRDITFRLGRAKNALGELRRLLKYQEENVTNLFSEYEQCANKMFELNKERKDYQSWLDNVRNTIAALKKVTVFVYEDGTIEIENAETSELPDGEFLAEFNELVSLSEVEDLTIKEIKIIAKLRMVVKSLDGETELVIDNPKIQSVWEKLAP